MSTFQTPSEPGTYTSWRAQHWQHHPGFRSEGMPLFLAHTALMRCPTFIHSFKCTGPGALRTTKKKIVFPYERNQSDCIKFKHWWCRHRHSAKLGILNVVGNGVCRTNHHLAPCGIVHVCVCVCARVCVCVCVCMCVCVHVCGMYFEFRSVQSLCARDVNVPLRRDQMRNREKKAG